MHVYLFSFNKLSVIAFAKPRHRASYMAVLSRKHTLPLEAFMTVLITLQPRLISDYVICLFAWVV